MRSNVVRQDVILSRAESERLLKIDEKLLAIEKARSIEEPSLQVHVLWGKLSKWTSTSMFHYESLNWTSSNLKSTSHNIYLFW